jgi:hypothetical protein
MVMKPAINHQPPSVADVKNGDVASALPHTDN